MKRIKVSEFTVFPFYSADEDEGSSVEIEPREYADYLAVCDLFERWQDRLRKLSPQA